MAIVGPEDTVANLTGGSRIIPASIEVITNNDPLLVQASMPSTRTTQQGIVTSAARQRNLKVGLRNLPDSATIPYYIIRGPVDDLQSVNLTWYTQSGGDTQSIFGYPAMSFYFSNDPLSSYNDFVSQADLWPSPNFNFTNMFVSFSLDSQLTDGNNLASRQSFWNFTHNAVYYMATYRLRVIEGTTTNAAV